MRRDAARRHLSDAEGLTLVELMMAMLVLGVIFSALGSVIISSLKAITTSEREVRATSLAQESIEELQAVAWEAAGLYSDEVTNAPLEWNGGDTSTHDGHGLVLLPPPQAGARLAQVPVPREDVDRSDVVYTVDRYVSWIDADGDGTTESKRFTAVVTWFSNGGEPRTITSVGERVPTQAESPATAAGTRVLTIDASPDPAELDAVTAGNLQEIVIQARLNEGVLSSPQPTLRFYTLGDVPAEGAEEVWVERTAAMTGTYVGANGWPTRWSATIPVNTYRFVNGPLELLFTAEDAAGNLIESFGSLRLRGGPLDGPAPRPATVVEGSTVFPAPPSASGGTGEGGIVGDPVRVKAVLVDNSPICVDKSTWKLTKDVHVTINASALDSTGNVTVTYLTWTERKKIQTVLKTDTAGFHAGNLDGSTWKLTIDQTAERMFRPTETITFTAEGMRDDGSNHLLESSGVTVSDSCAS